MSVMRCLLAAVCCEKGDVAGNLALHLQLMADAAKAGCDLALFPEMSLTGSADPLSSPQWLITLDHPAVARLAEASGETGVGVCFGAAERAPGGKPYITQVLAAAGLAAGVQRKRHLGEGEQAYTAASASAVFEYAGTRLGIAICAEAGFDAPFDQAAAAGARVVLFPPLRACMDGAPAKSPGGRDSPGGEVPAWATPAAMPSGWDSGSPSQARSARLPARTSPASPPWSAPTAASQPSSRLASRIPHRGHTNL
jgi:predicted amidohydrolase